MDELACRCATFINGCLSSDSDVVNFVARHGVYYRRMLSPIMVGILCSAADGLVRDCLPLPI